MSLLLLFGRSTSGTTFNQTVSVNCVTSVTMSRAIGKKIAVVCTSVTSWLAQKAAAAGSILRAMTVLINELSGASVLSYVRGSTVFFEASTVDANGNPVAPNGATLYLTYADLNLFPVKFSVPMTIANNLASYAWDSSVAADGSVRWSVKAVGGSTIVEDGTIKLTANNANPTP